MMRSGVLSVMTPGMLWTPMSSVSSSDTCSETPDWEETFRQVGSSCSLTCFNQCDMCSHQMAPSCRCDLNIADLVITMTLGRIWDDPIGFFHVCSGAELLGGGGVLRSIYVCIMKYYYLCKS